MAQRQVPGGKFVNEVGTAQRQIPGGAFVNETVSTGGAYTLACDAAAFTIAAQDATLLVNRVLSADAAAFTVAAQDATLTYTPAAGSYTLTCDAASFVLAAQDASLLVDRVLVADAAAFALDAQDATLTYAPAGVYTLACDAAEFVIGAQDAQLVYSGSASIGKRRKTKRLRWQDYDVPLPEPALLPVPPEAAPTPEHVTQISALAPRSIIARPQKRKAKAAQKVVAPVPVVVEQFIAPPKRRPMMLADILAADSLTPDQQTEAIKVLARLIGPAPEIVRAEAMDDAQKVMAIKVLAKIVRGPVLMRSTTLIRERPTP